MLGSPRSSEPTVFSAAAAGDVAGVLACFSAGRIDAQDSDGRTALHLAAAAGHSEVVKCLIERGAQVSTVDEGNWSPIHSAAAAGRSECLMDLLAAGANVDARAGSSASTALILAASKGRLEIVRALLLASANVQAVDKSGATALHRAAGRGELAIMELLLGALPAGTVIDARDGEGHTAFHVAAIHEQEHACVLLAEKGAELNTSNAGGEVPKALLKPSLRSQLGLADDEEAAEDHTDWLNASFPVPKVPRVA